jgi:hypothetical protein
MDYLESFIDWKVVDDCAAFTHSGIADSAPGAVADEMGDIFVPVWPVITEADSMKCVIEVKMATDWVCVKGDEDHILEF